MCAFKISYLPNKTVDENISHGHFPIFLIFFISNLRLSSSTSVFFFRITILLGLKDIQSDMAGQVFLNEIFSRKCNQICEKNILCER